MKKKPNSFIRLLKVELSTHNKKNTTSFYRHIMRLNALDNITAYGKFNGKRCRDRQREMISDGLTAAWRNITSTFDPEQQIPSSGERHINMKDCVRHLMRLIPRSRLIKMKGII